MEISNRTIVRTLAITVGFFLVLVLAYRLRLELTIIGTAAFLAIAINPLVDRLSGWLPRKNRTTAVLLVTLMMLAFVALLLWLVLPPLINQTHVLVHDLPQEISSLEQNDSPVGRFLASTNFFQQLRENHNLALQQVFFSRSSSILHLARSLFTGVVYGLTIFTLTLFMLLEGPGWLSYFWSLHPTAGKKHRQKLASQMYQIINRYVTVNLIFAVLAGLLTAGLLLLAGIPFVAPLAFTVALLELIPLVGPFVAAGIVVLVCLLNSVTVALVMLLFFLVYQHVKGSYLMPLVLAKAIPLSPLAVFISVIIGVSLAGILGALVAIPVGGCIQVLAEDYLTNHLA